MSGEFDWARLTYLLMALLLVSGAGYGFWRFRHDGRNAVMSLIIWALIIVVIVVIYNWFN